MKFRKLKNLEKLSYNMGVNIYDFNKFAKFIFIHTILFIELLIIIGLLLLKINIT